MLVALLHPIAIAIGRWVFAPELREAAAELLASGQDALQYAALITPASVAVYLSGVAVVLVGWAWYMLVPPWQPVRTPWVRKAATAAAARAARSSTADPRRSAWWRWP